MLLKSTITKHIAEREWLLWNQILFSNELITIPKFIIAKTLTLDSIDAEGTFEEDNDDGDACIIKIASEYARQDYARFSVILIHEMVHQLQWERHLDVEHDKFFYDRCAEIKNKIGLEVQ